MWPPTGRESKRINGVGDLYKGTGVIFTTTNRMFIQFHGNNKQNVINREGLPVTSPELGNQSKGK